MDDDDDEEDEDEDEEDEDGEEVQAEVVDEEDLETQARPGVSSVHFQQPAAEDGGDKGKGRMVHPPVAYRSRALSVDSVDEHMHIKVGPAQSPVTCHRSQATGQILEATCLPLLLWFRALSHLLEWCAVVGRASCRRRSGPAPRARCSMT
jgi:hypothetical protein